MPDKHQEHMLMLVMLVLVAIFVFFSWFGNKDNQVDIERRMERAAIMRNVDGNRAGAAAIIRKLGY